MENMTNEEITNLEVGDKVVVITHQVYRATVFIGDQYEVRTVGGIYPADHNTDHNTILLRYGSYLRMENPMNIRCIATDEIIKEVERSNSLLQKKIATIDFVALHLANKDNFNVQLSRIASYICNLSEEELDKEYSRMLSVSKMEGRNDR